MAGYGNGSDWIRKCCLLDNMFNYIIGNMKGQINVQGNGSIHVVPDVTRLEVTIESVFQNYDAAYKQAKENAQWMGQIQRRKQQSWLTQPDETLER